MEENRFFKYLWRINAIALFLMLCAGLFSFVSEQLLRSHRNYDQVAKYEATIELLNSLRAVFISIECDDKMGIESYANR